jgi:MFS family permease
LGSAILAPVLVKSASIDALCFVAGALFLFAAIRAVRLPAGKHAEASRPRERSGGFKLPSLGRFLAWMTNHMAVATMILVAAAVQALSSVFDTLQPIFVRDVLEADPANAVYIFLPGAVGAVIGTFTAPHLARKFGLRGLAVASLLMFAAAMMMFGLINIVAPVLGPLNPLRFVDRFGELGEELLAAGMIAILVKFATAATSIAVQTYINQRTPVEAQGSAFGMQAFISNAFGLTGTLTVGVLATVFGSRFVFLVAPLLVAVALVVLIQASFRMAKREVPSSRDAIATLFDESKTETV